MFAAVLLMVAIGVEVGATAVLPRAAGFTQTKVEPLLGGLVAIHSGWKI